MYPQPPTSHRPTNYFWVLGVCVAFMLVVVFAGLRQVANRLSDAVASGATNNAAAAPAAAVPTPAIQAEPTSVAEAAAISVSPTPVANGPLDVDPRSLQESPANYRSRLIRVSGTVFYVGKMADGQTWIQIRSGSYYINGQSADPLPGGVAVGSAVDLVGIGAGLTTITAQDGKDYDEPLIDPVQRVEAAGSSGDAGSQGASAARTP